MTLLIGSDGEAIEQFSLRVAEAWKIGRKGTDDGVILVVAKDDVTHRGLAQQFAERTTRRRYLALVWGVLGYRPVADGGEKANERLPRRATAAR